MADNTKQHGGGEGQGQQGQGGTAGSQGTRNSAGNFAQDPQRASEAGRKGGESRGKDDASKAA